MRGLTLLEVLVAGAVLGTVMVIAVNAVTEISRTSNHGLAEQQVTRTGAMLLESISRELRFADAATVQVSAAGPDRITFQQVLAYDANPQTASGLIRSRQVTLRRVSVFGWTGRFALERSESGGLGVLGTVTVCHRPSGVGIGVTLQVSGAQLTAHLAHGDTLGACGTEPTPSVSGSFSSPTRVLGAGISAADALLPTEPGLWFAVRRTGLVTFVDVAVTVEATVGTETARRRFTTTVRLVNG